METNSVVFATVLLLLLHFFVVSMSMAAILNITTDQSSLIAFKHHITHDPNNILAKNWSSNASVCNWIGVTCGSSDLRVNALNLSGMGLVGTIPPHIGNLSFLAHLSLRNNWFHGSLPNEMGQLHRMTIFSLGFNNFTGEIPSWFVLLPKLEWLSLSFNSFMGTIPSSLFNITSLQTLDIADNKLSGFLPSNFFMAPALQYVNVDNNKISGSIPSNIVNNSSIQVISLFHNSLSGELPENIFNQLLQLEELHFSQNLFSSKLPLSLFKCNKLQYLGLDRNNFIGRIPQEIWNLTMLEEIYFGFNNFSPGTIPREIGNLLHLKVLGLDHCNLRGRIPQEIGNLTMLKGIYLGFNNFSPGTIPHEIGNLHYLKVLSLPNCNLRGSISSVIFNISIKIINLDMNYLWGSLLPTLGFSLPNLEELYLYDNYFSGKIPNCLSNTTMLTNLELSQNSFSGYIPDIFGNLRKLKLLQLFSNNLTNEPSSPELSIINSLANCRVLQRLDLSNNPLNSNFPTSIGNLSNSLEYLLVGESNMWGSIPTSIGNLSGLIEIALYQNQMSGTIPIEIGKLEDLQYFDADDNKLEGLFPHELCKLKRIGYLYLNNNSFSGSIASCMGNLTSLRKLQLGLNAFNSTIPSNLWGLSDLLVLDLSSNELRGSLPVDIGNLNVLIYLNLSGNQLSGNIPSTIAQLQDLANLSLAQNRFEGSIPVSFGNMVSLELLNLSGNNLSGVVPNSLEALVHLKFFDVSFNKLEGEVPSKGPFKNFLAQSFMGNVGLCGGVPRLKLPNCKATAASKPSKTNAIVLKCVLPIVIALMLLLALTYVLIRRQKRTMETIVDTNTTVATWRRISYHELQQATNGFSDINLLGIGSFGKVYKGTLSNGMNIAVKVFNLELQGAFKSFDVECEILCNIRHRNLVKIISSCANLDFKALILNYMPNGNLEKWLHSQSHYLSVIQRLNIMIDVATALDYLHHGCSTPIVHCDLKPSNVLLDENMVGHLTDFGIGKLLNGGDSIRQTMTLATIGYMAPEYGLEGFVSRQCDVYSYGILLMETFTQKTPTNDMFQEEFSMRHWVEESYPNAIIDIVDVKLLTEDGVQYSRKRDCLESIMGLALECSAELPNERKNIKAVLAALQKIKNRFLNEARASRPIVE